MESGEWLTRQLFPAFRFPLACESLNRNYQELTRN